MKRYKQLLAMLSLFSLLLVALLAGRKILPVFSQASEEPILLLQNYTPPPSINDVAVDENFIWAATEEGIIKWDRNDSTFIKYRISDIDSGDGS